MNSNPQALLALIVLVVLIIIVVVALAYHPPVAVVDQIDPLKTKTARELLAEKVSAKQLPISCMTPLVRNQLSPASIGSEGSNVWAQIDKMRSERNLSKKDY